MRRPIHPGEVLWEEFLVPLLKIEPPIGLAVRLSEAFGTSKAFWENLEARFERDAASHDTFPRVDEVERLAKLRAAGVTHVTFHSDGELASVTFEPSYTPASADPEEEQRDPSTPVTRSRRSTGRLIPRGPTST